MRLWATLGAVLVVFAVVTWTRWLLSPQARVVARDWMAVAGQESAVIAGARAARRVTG